MFQTLLESRAGRARRTWGTWISIGVHTTAIALAVAVTARATAVTPVHSPEMHGIVYMPPPPPSRPIIEHVDGLGQPTVPRPSPIISLPRYPVELPELSLSIDSMRTPTEKGFGGPKPLSSEPSGSGSALTSAGEGNFYTDMTVEKAAMPLADNPRPTYPPALRAAQLEGSVTARFIVDTLGRAEPASIAFPEASHAGFADAVRQALLRSRYLPAMVAGRPVRQLVEQRFTFALQR